MKAESNGNIFFFDSLKGTLGHYTASGSSLCTAVITALQLYKSSSISYEAT